MTAFAVADDVTARWIGSDVPEDTIITTYLGDASMIMRFEFPDLDDRIASDESAAGHVDSAVARWVCVQMVTRKFRNPDNFKVQGSGVFAATSASDDPGGFTLTTEERAMLSGLPATGGQRAFTIDPTPQVAVGFLGGSALLDPFGAEDWSLG